MRERYFLLTLVLLTTSYANANTKKLVDCRFVSAKTTECKPYPSKFMYTSGFLSGKEVDFRKPHRLIISKTLPPIKRPKILKIIRVEDMIENYIKVLEPTRFADNSLHTARKKPILIEDINTTIPKDINNTHIDNRSILVKEEKLQKDHIATKKAKSKKKYPKYSIKKGDSIYIIAKRFKITTKELLAINNNINKKTILKIGKEIYIPLSKYKFNLIINKYRVVDKKGTKLSKKLKKKYLVKKKKFIKTLNEYNTKLISTIKGKHRLRVQATAYSSHVGQTDKTPFLAAWNNHIRPGMKIIAVSRDLISKYGLGNGKRVRIQGLPGYYTVRDKMNKRYTKRIDIYMGTNRRKALRWGRRRTVIYW